MFFVYILGCSDGTYYVGVTDDVDQHLQTHNVAMMLIIFSLIIPSVIILALVILAFIFPSPMAALIARYPFAVAAARSPL